MSRKHNTKHRRTASRYPRKIAEQGAGAKMTDPRLSDGRPASAKRS